MGTRLRIKIGDTWHDVEVIDLSSDPIEVVVDGEPVQVAFPSSGQEVSAGLDRPAPAPALPAASSPEPAAPEASPTGPAASPSEPAVAGPGPVKAFTSPMPGVIVSVAVKQGDQVVPGDEICVLEAMKMQQTLRAEWAGVVSEVHVQTGQQMQGGDPIVTLE
jgi:biotin carboxyl carrier protein